MSSTESKGICEVKINKEMNNITMICQNKDKFAMSQIMITRSFIKNSTNDFIFIINSYSSPEQFACDISLNSVKITVEENEKNKTKYVKLSYKTANTNLSIGAIIGIIIPLVVIIIALIIIFVIMKRGKKAEDIIHEESTFQKIVELKIYIVI